MTHDKRETIKNIKYPELWHDTQADLDRDALILDVISLVMIALSLLAFMLV